MRFAVINDIQGNIAALKAVLGEIDALRPPVERIVSSGDIVGTGANPNEVIDLLRERDIAAVRGNYDDAIVRGSDSSGDDFADEASQRSDDRALQWTRANLTEANAAFLTDLPRQLRLSRAYGGVHVEGQVDDEQTSEYRRNFFLRSLFGGFAAREPKQVAKRITVMHGTPRAINELVTASTAGSILKVIARDAKVDVLVTGHSGAAFRREESDTTFIGAGSVSGRHTPAGESSFAIVEILDDVKVEFGRATYDPNLRREVGLAPG